MYCLNLSALAALLSGISLSFAASIGAHAASVDSSPASTVVRAPMQMLAQSGSMGGTIGNREKSLSGSREAAPQRPAKQSKPKESRRPAASHGGGGGSLDGSWSVSSAGINCSDTFRETVIVSGRKLMGSYGSGSVSANGSISGSGNYNGIGVTSRGRFSGRSGSGTFQRSDGCHGRWTATKQ
ncbi:hypothetical protein ACWX0K_17125 [Nitrobacteraceae bacterium UC4446_H13]